MREFLSFCMFFIGGAIAFASISMAKANVPQWEALAALFVGGILMFSALFSTAKE